MLHVCVYYPRVTELSPREQLVTAVATDLLSAFQGLMPRDVPPAPVRDMTLGQLRLLFLLQREGPLPMGRIAEVFDLSTTASSGFVGRVERYGLVERGHRSDDRRVVECSLTEGGRRFVEGVSGMRLDLVRQGLATLEPEDLAELGRLLRLVRERIGRPA
jgi:DNA-binding MarR family transcriptional regulator